ncbi:MAG: integrase, partial [Paracoccaceae bacterium]|nr:integrase [Paracoccaceae bacterium]
MSIKIKYAYRNHQTWLYRRTYPKHLQAVLGHALKQSLKTGDARVAKARVIDVNTSYARIVSEAEVQLVLANEQQGNQAIVIREAVPKFQRATFLGQATIATLAKIYLGKRAKDLQPGTFR